MSGCFEGWEIYQTLPEPGQEYPPLPTFTNTDGGYQYFTDEMQDVQSVWYVREMTDVKFDKSQAVPEITGTDTGRRHYAFNMGNGPVLGRLAQTRGMARTYFREGTWLAGFWQNGQLFVIPLMQGFGCHRCNQLRIQKGLRWQVEVPAVDDYWLKMAARSWLLNDDEYSFWLNATLYSPDSLPYVDFYEGEVTNVAHGYEFCRSGKREEDADFLSIGDQALADYEGSEYYGQPGTIFEDPWPAGTGRISVYLRYKGVDRHVMISATARHTPPDEYGYNSYIFHARYESPFKKCFPDAQVYNRTEIVVTEYDGGAVTIIPSFVQNVLENFEDQLPTEVTVSLVDG